MTYQEFLTRVTTEPRILDELQEITDVYNREYSKYAQLPRTANMLEASSNEIQIVFLEAVNSLGDSYPLGHTYMGLCNSVPAIAATLGFTISDAGVTADLPIDFIKQALPARVLPKEKAKRNKKQFDANAKDLKLDGFSYAIFKDYLENNPKKLSGKDATRYLANLPRIVYAGNDNDTLYVEMYQKLIFDNVKTKSLELCKRIIKDTPINSSNTPSIDKAFQVVNSIIDIAAAKQPWATAVHFTYDYFGIVAKKYGLPMSVKAYYITESSLHPYVTGVKRRNTVSREDVIFAIDKLPLLLLAKSVDTLNCPYYDMAIDQIKEELSRDGVEELLTAHLTRTSASTAAVTEANKILTKITKEN